jgi:hypothetical protein
MKNDGNAMFPNITNALSHAFSALLRRNNIAFHAAAYPYFPLMDSPAAGRL